MDAKEHAAPLNIAVLGGGTSSLAAVWALTDPNNPAHDRIGTVTVYQLGWRLGGKGASGRGPYDRIEEHGLHIWLGFYENAFRMMREVYQELGRASDAPLARWDQAFVKHGLWVIDERIDDTWKRWPFLFPTDDEIPGSGGEFPSLHGYLELMLNVLKDLFQGSPHSSATLPRRLETLLEVMLREVLSGTEPLAGNEAHHLLHVVHACVRHSHLESGTPEDTRYQRIGDTLDEFGGWLRGKRAESSGESDDVRRLHIMVELLAACTRGLIRDVLLTGNHDLNALDDEDFRDWLKRHGASDEITNSAPVQGFLYDLAFAYEDGDIDRPKFATGTALRCALRLLFTYKGAIFWKMQAGMGDAVFAPIYEVLHKRGVRFKFFHAVRNLSLNADHSAITSMQVGRQVTLKGDEYQPLRDVKGLPCWPSVPDFDQIVEGAELQAEQINLESFWTPWQDRETLTLEVGRDFDVALLGISIASLPYICPELIEASAEWRAMVQHVKTTRTQAFQLWMHPSLEELGWWGASPVLDSYLQPLNTWADMSHLIGRENWPEELSPGSIPYFCGPMMGGIPDQADHSAPEVETQRVKDATKAMLENEIAPLWPQATGGDGPGLSWDLLLDPSGASGPDRFEAQFFRANIDPSERYVLSVPGSSRYRLAAGQSGFDKLILTGDWTNNGINAGCIEAAVMSGLLAAQAICGYPTDDDIVGYGQP
jgi:uncharacterized protein with NAD-binding domain and iron-sulfur cluster